GDDAPADATERARWREQAREWLWADLAQWGRMQERDTPQARAYVKQSLEQLQREPDLAVVRDQDGLAKLPQGERDAWLDLWDAVKTHLAVETHRDAFAREPNNVGHLINLGNALWSLNRLADAEKAYRDAIAIDRARAEAYVGLGAVLMNMRRY